MATLNANEFAIPSGAPSGGDQDMISFDGILIDNTTKKVTINPNAVAGGDLVVNGEASGIVLNVDASAKTVNIGDTIGIEGTLDEDNMSSDSATHWATQQSIKKYVDDTAVPGGIDTEVQYNNGSVFGGMNAMTYNDVTGAIILNAGAVTGGDVSINTLTSGVTLFADVSEGRVGIGLAAPESILHVRGDISMFERITGGLSSTVAIQDLLLDTAGDMADGFGPLQRFTIRDSAEVINVLGHVGFERDTADNEGKFVIQAGTNGVEEFLTIDNVGAFVHNPGNLSTSDFTLNWDTNISLFMNAADGNIGIGGLTDPDAVLHVQSGDLAFFERTTASTSTNIAAVNLQVTSSGDAAAGFGPSIQFLFNDTALTQRVLGKFGFIRGTADTEGDFELFCGTGGAEKMLSIDQTGKTILNASALTGGDIEILTVTSGTTFFADVSAGSVGIGNSAPGGAYKLDITGALRATSFIDANTNLHMTTDNGYISFGTGADVQMKYDGVNLTVDTRIVGSVYRAGKNWFKNKDKINL